jgi:class 3 adenylate cyclase/pimeloyl-ACP methyl ester carboxylesterase
MMVPKTRWARTVDGASIAYQDLGEGPVVVVIHGDMSHLEVYWEQPRFARFMRRLSRNMRVLHFDKRGVGMSDRISRAPDLDTRMDDLRAVMDAAGVDRAALLGWGYGGPALAVFFAATAPERTLAVCLNGSIDDRRTSDFPWGMDEQEQDEVVASITAAWSDEQKLDEAIRAGFGDAAGDNASDDPDFRDWFARFLRFAGTPSSYAAFEQMWYETNVRGVLASVQAPTMVLYKEGGSAWASKERANFLATRIPAARLTGIPGSAPVIWIEEPEPMVTAIENFILSTQQHEAELDRALATVLFTDIVASTDTASRIGDQAWKQVAEHHHTTVRALISRYRGNELDTAGDGFYASFDGPARAVHCAQSITEAMPRLGLHVRAGIHTGEVALIDGKPGGIAVSIGARIAGKAQPSEVLVSQTVRDLVAGSALKFEDRGTHDLKGVPGRWHLYAARANTPTGR